MAFTQMDKLIIVLLLSFMLSMVFAFFPTPTRVTRPGDETHESITKRAVLRAVATLFSKYPRGTNTFTAQQLQNLGSTDKLWKTYYGVGVSSKDHSEAVLDIVKSIQQAAADHITEAKWTFGGEQIKQGNQLLLDLKAVFSTMMLNPKPDYKAARDKLGEIFLVLQSFYANTNWINMNKNDIYTALGNGSATLLPIAPPQTPTCISCPPDLNVKIAGITLFDCDYTLDVKNVLTSGYRQGQDAVKPTGHPGLLNNFKQGKCSHGGFFDNTRKTQATGGINKGTANSFLSPHWMYHQDAAAVAMKHTEELLVGEEGILRLFGNVTFKKLLNIEDPKVFVPTTPAPKPPHSIGFVVDTTGSMSNDIAQVKQEIKAVLVPIRNRPASQQPTNYVLSVFNDPDVGPVNVTSDPIELLRWVEALTANGGGDCAEMAYGGIKLALEKMIPSNESLLTIYTDAPPKDEPLKGEVEKMAIDKKIPMHFFLTPGCGSRRKRSVRHQRSLFDRLANFTGGAVHQTPKAALGALLEELLKKAVATPLPSRHATSSVTISTWHLNSTTSARTLDIAVDGTSRDLLISIAAGPNKGYGIKPQLFNPNGTLEPQKNDWVVYYYGTATLQIWVTPNATFPGVWKLKLSQPEDYVVKAEGDSLVLLTLALEEEINLNYVALAGSPVPGKLVAPSFSFSSPGKVQTVSTLELYLRDGTTQLLSVAVTKPMAVYIADFTTPLLCKEDFVIRITGTDTSGNQFVREAGPYTVAGAVVTFQRLSPFKGPHAGQKVALLVTLDNICSTDEYYTLDVSTSSTSWGSEIKPSGVFVTSGSSTNVTVALDVPSTALKTSSSKITVKVSDTSGKVVNEVVRREDVPSGTPPSSSQLTHLSNTALRGSTVACDTRTLANCALSTWTMNVTLDARVTTVIAVPDASTQTVSATLPSAGAVVQLSASCCVEEQCVVSTDNVGNGDITCSQLPPVPTTTVSSTPATTTARPTTTPPPPSSTASVVASSLSTSTPTIPRSTSQTPKISTEDKKPWLIPVCVVLGVLGAVGIIATTAVIVIKKSNAKNATEKKKKMSLERGTKLGPYPQPNDTSNGIHHK